MGMILIIFLVGIALFAYLSEKKIYNILTVFCCLWLIITLISIIRPYNMFKTSDAAYMLVLIGTLGFSFGFFFRKKKEIVLVKKPLYDYTIVFTPRKNIIILLSCFCAVYGCIKLITVIQLVRQGYSFSDVRTMFSVGDTLIINGPIDNIINVFIYGSGTTVLSLLLVANIFKHSLSRISIFFSIIAVVTYAIISGGRYIFIALIVGVLYLIIIYRKTDQAIIAIKKQKKKVIFILFIGAFAVALITNLRFGEYFEERDISANSQYLLYFSGCMPLMSNWIDVINRNDYCTFGVTTIHGFIHVISLITRLVGVLPGYLYDLSTYFVDSEFQNFVYVAQGRSMNTFTSIFTYLYLDGRELGVFLGMFLYGYWCEHCYIKINEEQNIRNVLFFLLMLYTFSQTMIRWPFYKGTFVMAIVYVFILVKRNSVLKEKE